MEIMTKCTQCHQDFSVADHFFEREVFVKERLMLTVLVCPKCGYEVVTQIDNTDTLRLFQRQLDLLTKIGKRGNATPKQEQRRDDLTKALIAARVELNGEYNHTSYQFDGKEHKLDIHVPSMTISEE